MNVRDWLATPEIGSLDRNLIGHEIADIRHYRTPKKEDARQVDMGKALEQPDARNSCNNCKKVIAVPHEATRQAVGDKKGGGTAEGRVIPFEPIPPSPVLTTLRSVEKLVKTSFEKPSAYANQAQAP